MMTDRNGKPLKVGDKVKHQDYDAERVGTVVHANESCVEVTFDGSWHVGVKPSSLTLVEPNEGGVPLAEPPSRASLFASLFGNMDPAMKQVMEYEAAQWEENSHVSPFDRGSSDGVKAMKAAFSTLKRPSPFSVGMFGHIPRPKIDRFATMVEHSGTNVFEALGRDNAAELYAKAELVSRVRDIMGKFERARFPEIADEILKAVADYHE